jgi:transcription-repair coupling factor (superfamily II helicase)
LICTVIVENGIDVPRANTIIVDRADRFGIADLYQLRGRVGRSSRRGYAIFTVPAGRLDAEARERLSALNKYNGAGSGYDLSMRDLEIRGAGNLLGREQSGHIASVGFGLYCRLLRRTIAALKGEAPPVSVDVSLNLDFLELSPGLSSAASGCCIPYSYVEDEPLRMNLYKRLAEVSTEAEINALGREMADRFGKMPEQTRRLLDVSRLRILCAANGVLRIDTLNGKAVLRRTDGTKANRVAELGQGSVDDKLGKLFKAVRNL